MPSVSASAERICASLAAFMVRRIWAIDLPGVWAATTLACASCSSVTTPRSSSRASTLLRAVACSGDQSCSNSETTSSAAPLAGALVFSAWPLPAGVSEVVLFRPHIRLLPSSVFHAGVPHPRGPRRRRRGRRRPLLLLHLQLELDGLVLHGAADRHA